VSKQGTQEIGFVEDSTRGGLASVHLSFGEQVQALNHRLGSVSKQSVYESGLVVTLLDGGLGVLGSFNLVLKFVQEVSFGRTRVGKHGRGSKDCESGGVELLQGGSRATLSVKLYQEDGKGGSNEGAVGHHCEIFPTAFRMELFLFCMNPENGWFLRVD
jgi:hypothetical protein